MKNKFMLVLGMIFGMMHAQYRTIDSYAFFASYSFFKSDFGARNDWNTNLHNNSYELGAKIFANPFPYSAYWGSHFKVYGELHVLQGKLQHIGRWTEGPDSPMKDRLKAMKAKPFMAGFNLGFDFSLQDLRYYNFTESYGIYKFNAYIGLAVGAYYYKPNVYSELGDVNDPAEQISILIPRFVNKVYNDAGFVIAPSLHIGFTYQLNYYMQIFWENRFTWFSSDRVDGLDVNDSADKYHDWLVSPSFGLLIVTP